MASTIGNVFQTLTGRGRNGGRHERLENDDIPDEQEDVVFSPATENTEDTDRGNDLEAGLSMSDSPSRLVNESGEGEQPAERTNAVTDTNSENDDDNNNDNNDNEESDDDGIMDDNDEENEQLERFSRSTVSLAELEEERELARRRTSACVLLAVFVLFRLWVQALQSSDYGLLLLCLVGTSWTARWIRHNRDREEELDRRISAYLENSEPGTTEVDRNDLRMLSFQAQLALAIMESQRQMMQGGFGHPDGTPGTSGISDEAKDQWERYKYKEGTENTEKTRVKGGYGSVSQKEGLQEDGPSCSICLGEYEEGEQLVRLPCGHVYHDDCISSWTTNHTRCPLCNCDLESSTTVTSSQTTESIV